MKRDTIILKPYALVKLMFNNSYDNVAQNCIDMSDLVIKLSYKVQTYIQMMI